MPPGMEIVIYGAAGFAVGIRDMIQHGLGLDVTVAAFIDDFNAGAGRRIGDAPVIDFDTWHERFSGLPVVLGVGDPAARKTLAGRVAGAGGGFATAVKVMGAISPDVAYGTGTVIGYPVYVGPFTQFGRHNLVMPFAVVGHDVRIGDFCTVCSSANIAGYVVIEDEVFIGAGAVIVNGRPGRELRIGRGARIGAGAVVMKPVPAGMSVAGNPARPLRDIAADRLVARKSGAT